MQKDHLEVILEDINSKFDLVLEGHQVLHDEILELGRKTDERFDLVDFKIDTLNEKIDTVDEKLSERIDSVDERLSTKIDSVEGRLSKKINAIATGLKAHRADTEMHHGV